MLHFEIDGFNIKDLGTFLYVNRDKLDNPCQFIVKTMKDTEIEQAKYISDIAICIGFGTHIYNMDENTKITIVYEEKGQPVGTYASAIMYNNMTVLCETFEIWKKFNTVVNEFIDQFDVNESDKLNIYIVDKYGDWSKYSKIPSRLLSTIYVDDSIKQQLKTDITKFVNDEMEYEKFGIPYKRTYMITGVPGSGKTSIIKALCNEIEKNLCILSMNKDFDNSTILNAFRNMRQKSFLLIEDIDCLFEKREHKDTPLITFSSFINLLDGVLYKHGLICFITTNHPERLDPALLRSGRMDLILKIDYPSKTDIKRLFTDLTIKTLNESQIEIEFNKFMDKISNKNMPMSAIVTFLFKYRADANNHIKELLSSNSMIADFTGEKSATLLYN
jgi:hypothetical protein